MLTTPPAVTIMAFDPSLSSTGWAVLHSDGTQHGKLVCAGRIVPDGDTRDYPARLSSLFLEAKALIDEYEPRVVVVETPTTHGHHSGSHSGTYHTGQPIYGSALGAVVAAAACPVRLGTRETMTPPRIIAYAADVWTRGLPRHAMMTRDDPHKTRRVQFAADLYRLPPSDFGTKSHAGDVADAVLLGRHGLYAMEGETQWRGPRGGHRDDQDVDRGH